MRGGYCILWHYIKECQSNIYYLDFMMKLKSERLTVHTAIYWMGLPLQIDNV